jgi:osmotically-inducible protein OsmY
MAERYEDQYRRDRGYRGDRGDRGFVDRAGDEVRSWFGDDEAERRRQMDDRERGQFRDRDYGGAPGSRPGWSDDRRYGQSSERYGQGGDYGSGSYGRGSYGSGGYGSGSGSYYGSSDRGQLGTSDRSYGSGGSSWSQRDDRGGMGWFSGRGPKGYQRSDSRINEDVCDRLCDSPDIDATDVEVNVANGEVTLTGSVSDRNQKRRAEDLIEQISGVREVHNNLRVSTGSTAGSSATAGSGSAVSGEQPGNVLGVGGGAPDKASTAGR